MELINSTVSVFFVPTETNIKSDVINNSNVFSDVFCEPAVLPVPDTMPNEVPRVNLFTLVGNSILNISNVSATLNTQYFGVDINDWEKLEKELEKPTQSIFGFLKESNRNQLAFTGVTLTILHKLNNDESVVEFLNRRFNKFKTDYPLYDYSTRLAVLVDKDYFVNLSLSNVKVISSSTNPLLAGNSPDDSEQALQIIIDINDKHAFNNYPDYASSQEKLNKVFELCNHFVENISSIIDKGHIGDIQNE